MKKNIYVLLALSALVYACGGGGKSVDENQIAEEERTIDGRNVQITAQKFQRTGGASGQPQTYITYSINVDKRGAVGDVGYITPLQADKPADALKLLEISFSKSGEHMQAKVNAKGGYSTYFHFLPDGPPFRLAFREANHDLWANKSLEELPSVSVMVDSMKNGKREGYLTRLSLQEFHGALSTSSKKAE